MSELDVLRREKARLEAERKELDETARLRDEIKAERKKIKLHKHRKAIKISKGIGKGLLKTGKVLFDVVEKNTRPEKKIPVRKLDKLIIQLEDKEKEDKK